MSPWSTHDDDDNSGMCTNYKALYQENIEQNYEKLKHENAALLKEVAALRSQLECEKQKTLEAQCEGFRLEQLLQQAQGGFGGGGLALEHMCCCERCCPNRIN